MGQAARVFQWLSLAHFLPPLSYLAVLRLHRSVCPVAHTWTGSVWFICSLMSWMLPRIFFWWPASVTPIRSRSLWIQKEKEENKNRWLSLKYINKKNQTNITCLKWKGKFNFSHKSKHTFNQAQTVAAPWKSPINWHPEGMSTQRRHSSSYSERGS